MVDPLHEGHQDGDKNCTECWRDYPKPCACGGLIHANFGDYTGDDYYLDKACDRCGGDDE